MGLLERCSEINETSEDRDLAYEHCAFIIRSEIYSKPAATLTERRRMFEEKISTYAAKYNLSSRKLGRMLSPRGLAAEAE